MGLLPNLYLNENIPLRLTKLLSASCGITAIHTYDAKNQRATDEFQLQYAADKHYVLVTHNRRHFSKLHKQWIQKGKSHAGIIVIGCGEPEDLAERLRRFFKEIYPNLTPPFCESPPKGKSR